MTTKIKMTSTEYMALAEKYEDNDEVRRLVVFTHEGAKHIYYGKGFIRGVTFGLLFALALTIGIFGVTYN